MTRPEFDSPARETMASPTPPRLAAVVQMLEARRRPWTAVQLAALLAEPIRLEDLRPWLHFDPERYARITIRRGDGYELLVLCWEPGQATPVHDHDASECAVRVIDGALREQRFVLVGAGDGMRARPVGAAVDLATAARFTIGPTGVHRVENPREGGRRAVSVHIYAPPLARQEGYPVEEPQS